MEPMWGRYRSRRRRRCRSARSSARRASNAIRCFRRSSDLTQRRKVAKREGNAADVDFNSDHALRLCVFAWDILSFDPFHRDKHVILAVLQGEFAWPAVACLRSEAKFQLVFLEQIDCLE